MSHVCGVCDTPATSDSDVFLDVDYSDDAKWHQSDLETYNQNRVIVCGSCLNINWVNWRQRIIVMARIVDPLRTTTTT